MAASGVRAKNFIKPAGREGADAIFRRRRGLAPAPAVGRALVAADPGGNNSRTGKATGRDYGNFFSKKRNVSAIQGAVNALKGLLVGTLIAAKSLGSTLKSVVGQINGFVSSKGGGFFGKLAMVGLVAAVVVGVAAIFGPQIKKAFDFVKNKANEGFLWAQEQLEGANDKLKTFYEAIRTWVNDKIIGMIAKVNEVLKSIKGFANGLFHLPNDLVGIDIRHITGPIKNVGKAIYGLPEIPSPKPLPEYDKILGANGINFLKGYDSLGDFGSSMMSGLGGMLTGGIDMITGGVGDMLNNLFASMGLTDKANDATTFLGLGKQFGPARNIGSGPGISSLFPGGSWGGLGSALGLPTGPGQQQQSGGSGTSTGYGGASLSGAAMARVGNDAPFLAEVKRISQKFQIRESDLLGLMASESGLDPKSDNGSHVGLIQFSADSAAAVGTTQAALKRMSRAQQMKYVEKYFDYWKLPKGASAGQLYSVVFAPAYASKNNDTVLYRRGSAAYRGNAPLDANKDGSITVGEMGKRIEDKKTEFGISDVAPPPPPAAPAAPAPAAPAQAAPPASTRTTAPPKPVNTSSRGTASPGGITVAAAPQRPRPDIAPENISATDGNPKVPFPSPSFPDALTVPMIGSFT